MKDTVFFDLGGTLVEYYTLREFPSILEAAIGAVSHHLAELGRPAPSWEEIWRRTTAENHEAGDYRVRALEDRLARIFQLHGPPGDGSLLDLCRLFMQPIFARARLYDDAIPALTHVQSAGYRAAIISNTPWGSPAALWREELHRLSLDAHLDDAIFCCDSGWRKPAPEIFTLAMERLDTSASHCVFVGDDPRWDVMGPLAAGMDVVLLDRAGIQRVPGVETITTLDALPDILAGWR